MASRTMSLFGWMPQDENLEGALLCEVFLTCFKMETARNKFPVLRTELSHKHKPESQKALKFLTSENIKTFHSGSKIKTDKNLKLLPKIETNLNWHKT